MFWLPEIPPTTPTNCVESVALPPSDMAWALFELSYSAQFTRLTPTEPCALNALLAVLSRASTQPWSCATATARAETGTGAAPHKLEKSRGSLCAMMTSIACVLF
jgi:hypothetical protein